MKQIVGNVYPLEHDFETAQLAVQTRDYVVLDMHDYRGYQYSAAFKTADIASLLGFNWAFAREPRQLDMFEWVGTPDGEAERVPRQ